MRRETSSRDSGTEILHKSENPSSDSLEMSKVREPSSRDDWFNGLSRSDSGQVADYSSSGMVSESTVGCCGH